MEPTAIGLRWRRAIKTLRICLRLRCLLPLRRAVRVVIVNWNTLVHLRETVRAVRLFSPDWTRIPVVDNGSSDGSVEWLRSRRVPTVDLGTNVGHVPGIDLGWSRARTETVVALDLMPSRRVKESVKPSTRRSADDQTSSPAQVSRWGG